MDASRSVSDRRRRVTVTLAFTTFCACAGLVLVLAPALAAPVRGIHPLGIPREDWAQAQDRRGSQPAATGALPDSGGRPSLLTRSACGALHAYRVILSSQDARHCQFHPSCSHYAEGSIRQHGLLVGALMASDRLQRCNPRAYSYYPYDVSRTRLLDPVRRDGEPPPVHPLTMASPRPRALAMGLSAVLPGAGQIYAGRAWDGLYSFIQVSAPATFSYLNYRREGARSIRGAAHGLLAAGFYAGCVYGAGRSAAERRVEWATGALVVNRPVPDSRKPPIRPDDYADAFRRWAEGDVGRSAESFREIRRRGPTELAARAAFFEAMTEAEIGRWDDAERALGIFLESCPEPADRAAVRDALLFLERRRAERAHDARIAGCLSALVPGTGQLWAGRPGAAAAALVVNSFFGYYAYETTRTDSWAEFAIFAVPTFWRYYRGNIRTAARLAASRHDRTDAVDLERRLGL